MFMWMIYFKLAFIKTNIISASFVDYMDRAPFYQGLWSFVETALNKTIDIEQMRLKFQDVKRCVI